MVVILALSKRQFSAIVTAFLYLSLLGLIITFSFYFVKIGGFKPSEKKLLVGTEKIIKVLQFYPIKTDTIALLLLVFRNLFTVLFILNSILMNYSVKVFFTGRKWLFPIIIIPFLIDLFILNKQVFQSLFAYNFSLQQLIVYISDFLIDIGLFVSVLFFFFEMNDIGIPIMRKMHSSKTISNVLLCLIFSFFSSLNPVTVYQDYHSVIVYSSVVFPIQGYNVFNKWLFVLSFGIILLVTVLYQNIRYYKYNYDRNKNEILISRNKTAIGPSASILVHGIKNQIIVSEVLIADLKEKLTCNKESSSEEEIVNKLEQQISLIRKRLDVIYKSFLKVELSLRRTTAKEILILVQKKLADNERAQCIEYFFDDAYITADQELLSEAIYNIVVNAIEATMELDDPYISVTIKSLKARVMITVHNNGNPISDKIRKKLFQPFTTTKNTESNWGLGLFYTNMIVKLHFGEILEESDSNGTSFMILLPKERVKE